MATTVHTRSDKEINAQIKSSVNDLLAAGTALGLADLQGRPHKVTFRCPLHGGCSAGAAIKDGGPVWHCFGCGAGGGYFDLVEAATGISDWGEIRERAAKIAGVTLPPRHTPDDGLPIVPVELLVRLEDLVWLDALLARAAGTDLLGADDLVEAVVAPEPSQEVVELAQEVDELVQEVDELVQEVEDELAQNDAAEAEPEPASAPPAPPAREAEYAQLWSRCLRLDDPAVPPEAIDYLRGRALPPGELLDLVRVLPQGVTLPSWAACKGISWTASKHLVIVRIVDAAGRLAGLRARCIDPACRAGEKELVAGGVKVAGTVLADGPAETVIRLGPDKVAAALRQTGRKLVVMVAEGVPDWLTLSAWARRWRATSASAGAMLAVVGTYSGGWTQALADRLPRGTRVIVRTHSDERGCEYRDAISGTLWARRCLVEVRHPDGIPTARKSGDENDDLRLLGLGGIDPLAGNTARPAPPRGGWPLTDQGNAERLVHRHGADLRYCAAWGKWLAWDGARWDVDNPLEVDRRAVLSARAIRDVEAERPDPDRRKLLTAWSYASESDKSISATLRRARAIKDVEVKADVLDADPWLLGCRNGAVDLRAGRLVPGARSLLITKRCGATFDPAAKCLTWERVLDEVFEGNQSLISFFLRLVGYTLTGQTGERKLVVLHGVGRNGKGLVSEVISRVLGDYASAPDASLLVDRVKGQHTTDLADLRGVRLAAISEVEEGARLTTGLAKKLSGGKTDKITARKMRQDNSTFVPTHKIWIALNHLLKVSSTDQAIWDRLIVIPFNRRFNGPDPCLIDKLTEELDGILAWAVQGCLAWQREGLNPPDEVRVKTEQARDENDELGRFFDEECELGDSFEAPPGHLYEAYRRWHEASGERGRPLSVVQLGAELPKRGFAAGLVGPKTRRVRVWRGLRLRGSEAEGQQHEVQFELPGLSAAIEEVLRE